MSGGVFVLREDGRLASLRDAHFAEEKHFQDLVARFPELLAGDQINPETPRRWLLIKNEAAIGDPDSGSDRWYVDRLLLDQDGVPTLVEIKRQSDSRLRREVFGQILEYAANAQKRFSAEKLRGWLVQQYGGDEERVTHAIGALVGSEGTPGSDIIESFWKSVEENISKSRLRLLLVADRVPTEVRRIIEFLNEQMRDIEVLAVELRQYEGEGLKTIVPRVIGQSEHTRSIKQADGRRTQWTQEAFLRKTEEQAGVITRSLYIDLMQAIESHVSYLWFGDGSKIGSWGATTQTEAGKVFVAELRTNGYVYLDIGSYKRSKAFSAPNERLKISQKLKSDQIYFNATDADRRLSVPSSQFENDDFKREQFIKLLRDIAGALSPERI